MLTIQTARRPAERCPHHLRRDGFNCPVDWRWKRAEWRLQTGSRSSERQDDEWTQRAIKQQRWVRRGRTDKVPDIDQAQRLFIPSSWNRVELEARILANQPIGAIASVMGVSENAIEAFEALFFDVRRRLHAQDWVTISVLGSKTWERWTSGDVKFVWRCLGFQYGSAVVDALVNGAERCDLELSGLPAYWGPKSRLPYGLQFFLLSRSFPDQGAEALTLFKRFNALGLCEALPHYDRPPKDLSVDMSGEYSWGETGSWMCVKEPVRADLVRAA